jgi:hypothetical protein
MGKYFPEFIKICTTTCSKFISDFVINRFWRFYRNRFDIFAYISEEYANLDMTINTVRLKKKLEKNDGRTVVGFTPTDKIGAYHH